MNIVVWPHLTTYQGFFKIKLLQKSNNWTIFQNWKIATVWCHMTFVTFCRWFSWQITTEGVCERLHILARRGTSDFSRNAQLAFRDLILTNVNHNIVLQISEELLSGHQTLTVLKSLSNTLEWADIRTNRSHFVFSQRWDDWERLGASTISQPSMARFSLSRESRRWKMVDPVRGRPMMKTGDLIWTWGQHWKTVEVRLAVRDG